MVPVMHEGRITREPSQRAIGGYGQIKDQNMNTRVLSVSVENLHVVEFSGMVQAWVAQKLLKHDIIRVFPMSDVINI